MDFAHRRDEIVSAYFTTIDQPANMNSKQPWKLRARLMNG